MIAENIQKLRKLHNTTQENLAEVIAVSRQTVAKWEKGESIPDVISCKKIAEFFHISVDTLLNYDESKHKLPFPSKGKHAFGMINVGKGGQIVLPQNALDIFNICEGDSLIVLGDEERGLALMKTDELLRLAEMVTKDQQISGDGENI